MSDLQTVTVPGANALAELERLRAERERTGLYPVLLGNDEEFERVLKSRSYDERDVGEVLAASLEIDPVRWFAEVTDTIARSYHDSAEEADLDLIEETAEIGEEFGGTTIGAHCDVLSHEPYPEVVIALLPVQQPWEAFAHLRWGSWNDCPSPEVHCALHRYWQSNYGAEPASVTADVVECFVANPPATPETAMALGREQYLYCQDIVEQGTETVSALAGGLLGSNIWYFWWD